MAERERPGRNMETTLRWVNKVEIPNEDLEGMRVAPQSGSETSKLSECRRPAEPWAKMNINDDILLDIVVQVKESKAARDNLDHLGVKLASGAKGKEQAAGAGGRSEGSKQSVVR